MALNQDVPEVPDCLAPGDAISQLRREIDRAFEMGDGRFDLARVRREAARFPAEAELVGRVGGDFQGKLHVGERVSGRGERARARRRAAKCHPRLCGHGSPFLAAGLGVERLNIVLCQHPRQLIVAEHLEVSSSREMTRPSVALRQRAVGDLLDEALDESVLASLG